MFISVHMVIGSQVRNLSFNKLWLKSWKPTQPCMF